MRIARGFYGCYGFRKSRADWNEERIGIAHGFYGCYGFIRIGEKAEQIGIKRGFGMARGFYGCYGFIRIREKAERRESRIDRDKERSGIARGFYRYYRY